MRNGLTTQSYSDAAHEGVRLQPENNGRVRGSAWLGVAAIRDKRPSGA